MNILILGSTGATGKQVVLQSIQQHHQVTALARDPSKLDISDPLLTIVKGDVLDPNILARILEGKDAVISALGIGKSLKSNDLITNAVASLVPLMTEKRVSRLIFLSAFGAGTTFPQANFIQKLVFRFPLKNMYADKTKADEIIRNTKLDWTLVYPVLLHDKPAAKNYKVGEKMEIRGMPTIARADVADFMIAQLTDNSFIQRCPIIMG